VRRTISEVPSARQARSISGSLRPYFGVEDVEALANISRRQRACFLFDTALSVAT
jgi:hypothetical protein